MNDRATRSWSSTILAEGKTVRYAVLFLGASMFAPLAVAQSSWWRTYGGSRDDLGYSARQTSDGGYIVAGMTKSFGVGPDSGNVYLVKTDAGGNTLWTRTYGSDRTDEGYSIVQTSDGSYIVAGMSSSLWAYGDVYLTRTDSSGDSNWVRNYGGRHQDLGKSVQQTTDGGYVIAGLTNSFPPGTPNLYIVKTDDHGDTQWTRAYGDRYASCRGNSVRQTRDGGYIIAGDAYVYGAARAWDVLLIKTDALGDTQWAKTYGGIGDLSEYGRSVQQTSDGGYIIAGYTESFGAGGRDAYLIKTDSQGDTLWTRTYGGPDDEYGYSVQRTFDGGYIIAGVTRSFGAGGADVYLTKTNSQGHTLWTRTFGGPAEDFAMSVSQTLDSGYVVAGATYSFGAGGGDVYLIKTDASGNVGLDEDIARSVQPLPVPLKVQPNPFSSAARVPGHEAELFALTDITGRRVGVYAGCRIGEELRPGVYFLVPAVGSRFAPFRAVRIVRATPEQ